METSRINKLLKSDIFLKIVSVFMAITLWAYVSFVLDPETTKEYTDVPVRFINEQELTNVGLAVIDKEYSVNFEVKGRRNLLTTIDKERLWAVADLSGYDKPGRNRVSVKISGIPSNVSLVVEPEDIFIELDKSLSVSKPITVDLKGETQQGFKADTPVINPANVRIDGPQKIVNDVRSAKVVVDISNLDGNFSTKERIKILDSRGNEIKGIKTDVDTAEVTVQVSKNSGIQSAKR